MHNFICESYFERLGAKVGRLWKERRYDELAFPDVAVRVLRDDPPNKHVSFWDAVKYGFFACHLPYQGDIDAKFGQPPLTVYWQPSFHIELLFWVQGLPGIHQHAFSGAFHVMHGSSLHSVWKFECEERVVTRLLYGNLRLKQAELLRAGDTRPIVAGHSFIHATYHLDRPSISVVIRTNREDNHLPQYTYLPPSIAYESIDVGPIIKRRLQLLRMLNSTGRYAELRDIILYLLEDTDTYSTFHYLLEAYALFKDETDRNRVLLEAYRKHRRLVELCSPALVHQERREKISGLRSKITNPDLQYFLALLLNLPDRESILKLIRERYTHADPITKIVGWMKELSQLDLTDAKFPDIWLLMLRSLLSGDTMPQIEQTFADRYGSEAMAGKKQEIEQLGEAISNYWLLRPLFNP